MTILNLREASCFIPVLSFRVASYQRIVWIKIVIWKSWGSSKYYLLIYLKLFMWKLYSLGSEGRLNRSLQIQTPFLAFDRLKSWQTVFLYRSQRSRREWAYILKTTTMLYVTWLKTWILHFLLLWSSKTSTWKVHHY